MIERRKGQRYFLIAQESHVGSYMGIHTVLQSSFFQCFSIVRFPVIVGVCGSVRGRRNAEFFSRIAQLRMGDAGKEQQAEKYRVF